MNTRRLTSLTVLAARLVVGGTFTFSGLAKAIDPWGSLYKFEAYFAAMRLPGWMTGEAMALFGSVALSAIEFLAGVMLLTGCYRRVSSWIGCAIMTVMLPLSLWIAVADPVSDCGCFGDALIISNWATFAKNLVLMAGAVWLVMRNRALEPLINRYLQWLGFLASMAFILTVEWLGYQHQPVVDFRPYPVGTELFADGDGDAGDSDGGMIFVYRRGDEERTFGVDDTLPDESEGWTFVERRSATPDTRHAGAEHEGLRLWDEAGDEDVTDVVAPVEGEAAVVVMPMLSGVSISSSWKLNSLYDRMEASGGDMIAVTMATPDEIAAWRDLSLAEYPIYTAEDTALKEVVRGNPGIVALRDGRIQWKGALTAIDSGRLDGRIDEDAAFRLDTLRVDDTGLWRALRVTWLCTMSMLAALSWFWRPGCIRYRLNRLSRRLSPGR